MTTPTTPNAYALPSGQIVNLPSHCTDPRERFTLADRTVVWAVRVVNGDVAGAQLVAREKAAPRKA